MFRQSTEGYIPKHDKEPEDPSKREFIKGSVIVPFAPQIDRLEKVLAALSGEDGHIPQTKEKIVEQFISPIFSEGVQQWNQSIGRWAKEYNIDPNIIATIMEIESGGDPNAESPNNDYGLFQVNIQHFQEGEDYFDVDLNAQKAIALIKEEYYRAEKDLHAMFAGYNGGFMATLWMIEGNEYNRDNYIEWTKNNFMNQNVEEQKALELAIAKADTVEHYADIAMQLLNHATDT